MDIIRTLRKNIIEINFNEVYVIFVRLLDICRRTTDISRRANPIMALFYLINVQERDKTCIIGGREGEADHPRASINYAGNS